MPRSVRRPVAPGRRALFLAGVALALALLAEAGVRLWALVDDARTERALSRLAAADGGESAADPRTRSLADLIRPSAHPRIIYELRPGLELRVGGASLSTSPEGFRSPSIPLDKPPGTVRVVGLGDSFMYGWMVSDEVPYPRRLERRLNEGSGGVAWQVLNTAVPGYNTAMEVATLRHRALVYRPDLVILHHVGNDAHLPNFIRAREDYLTWKRSFLLETLRARGRRGPRTGLVDAPMEGGRYLDDPARVPPEYADMVGVEGVRAALAELGALARRHGFRVLFVHHNGTRASIVDAARDAGFQVLTLRRAREIEALARVEPGRAVTREELVLGPTDPHPSALGHAAIAELIRAELEGSGLRLALEAAAHSRAPTTTSQEESSPRSKPSAKIPVNSKAP